jgi:hypothetical protein
MTSRTMAHGLFRLNAVTRPWREIPKVSSEGYSTHEKCCKQFLPADKRAQQVAIDRRVVAMYSWQDEYIAALAETDPAKQRRRVYEAQAAMEQRLSPIEPGSEEHQALRTRGASPEDSQRQLAGSVMIQMFTLLVCCRNGLSKPRPERV